MPDEPGWGAWQQLPPPSPRPQFPPGAPPPEVGAPEALAPEALAPEALAPEAPASETLAPEALVPGDVILPVARHRAKGRVFLTLAAAVALVGAGTGTSLALSASNSAGATTPAGAVGDLFTALGKSDVVGMLDALAPGERNALDPACKTSSAS